MGSSTKPYTAERLKIRYMYAEIEKEKSHQRDIALDKFFTACSARIGRNMHSVNFNFNISLPKHIYQI